MEDQVATFRLASGSGPVHLSGTHQTETNVIADDDDFGEEGEDDDEDDLDDVEDSPVIIHVFFIKYRLCFQVLENPVTQRELHSHTLCV